MQFEQEVSPVQSTDYRLPLKDGGDVTPDVSKGCDNFDVLDCGSVSRYGFIGSYVD